MFATCGRPPLCFFLGCDDYNTNPPVRQSTTLSYFVVPGMSPHHTVKVPVKACWPEGSPFRCKQGQGQGQGQPCMPHWAHRGEKDGRDPCFFDKNHIMLGKLNTRRQNCYPDYSEYNVKINDHTTQQPPQSSCQSPSRDNMSPALFSKCRLVVRVAVLP